MRISVAGAPAGGSVGDQSPGGGASGGGASGGGASGAGASGRAPSEDDAWAVWQVYDAVFGDVASYEAFLADPWGRHVAREGFRLARADDNGLVGFAWGYTGQPGQWWTDRAAAVMGERLAKEWLGGHFELVELAVLPAWRSRGVGRALVTALVAGVPHDRILLMTTADPADPARRLYESLGWSVLSPGLTQDTVIMGRRGGVG